LPEAIAMLRAAAATDGRIRSYEDFARVHAYLLAAVGIPPSLHERLYRKLTDEVFDGGEVFAVEPCEGGRQRRLRGTAGEGVRCLPRRPHVVLPPP